LIFCQAKIFWGGAKNFSDFIDGGVYGGDLFVAEGQRQANMAIYGGTTAPPPKKRV